MKKTYLKPESGIWFLFTKYGLCTMIWWEWEKKKPKKYIYKKENKEKIPHFGFPSHPPVYKIEGWLFSGSKETGNKPDLP